MAVASAVVQYMCKEVRNRVRVGDEFGVGVDVHQGSVPSSLLLIIVRGSIQGVSHRLSMGATVRTQPENSAESIEKLLV